MGKLTEAHVKLDNARKSFVADLENWQNLTKQYFVAVRLYQQKLSELTKIDDQILDQIKDGKQKSLKSAELANLRGKKLAKDDPSGTQASQAQQKAFSNCDTFAKVIEEFKSVLKTYETKGKPTKEQKKVEAEKLLLQAKIDLIEVKKEKLNYEYFGDGSAQYSDVKAAFEKLERLKKKLAEMTIKLKGDVVIVDTTNK